VEKLYIERIKLMKAELQPYTIDESILKRFDERQNVFGRMLYDKSASFYRTGMYDKVTEIITVNNREYSRVEFARTMGAWTVYDYFRGAFSWKKLNDANSIMNKPELDKYSISKPDVMSMQLKETAKIYGANLVGISELDHRWLYSYDMDGNPIEIPLEYKYAVVIAIKMDRTAINTSPNFSSCTATGIGYSRMAFCIACLSEFIRNLGYKAIPMGNDTALSIPLAIDAGLGALGRHGLLITPEYGTCVRICKLFTDLPLLPDKPLKTDIPDFCRRCDKCAIACKVNAISKDKDPSFNIACKSNNPGILRWAVNHDKCYSFWIENGGDCSNCIAACPFI
jgi:epoxyqueuosine reductase